MGVLEVLETPAEVDVALEVVLGALVDEVVTGALVDVLVGVVLGAELVDVAVKE